MYSSRKKPKKNTTEEDRAKGLKMNSGCFEITNPW